MKKLALAMFAAGVVCSTFSYADFHRIIKNFTNDTCQIVSLHGSEDMGSVRFDFSTCDNAGQPPAPDGQNYCYLPAGQTVGVVYTTNANPVDSTQGSLEFKCGTSFDQTVSFSGQDHAGEGLSVNESRAPNMSDNHGDICIGVAAGHCQPHNN